MWLIENWHRCPHEDFPDLDLCEQPYSEPVEIVIAITTIIPILVLVRLVYLACTALKKDEGAFNGSYFFVAALSLGGIFFMCSILAWPMHNNQASCFIKPIFHLLAVVFMAGMLTSRVFKVWFYLVYRPRLSLHRIMDWNESRLTQHDVILILSVWFIIQACLLCVLYSVEDYRPYCKCLNFTDSDELFTQCTVNGQFAWILVAANAIPIFVTAALALVTVSKFRRERNILGIPAAEIADFRYVSWSFAVFMSFISVVSAITYR